VRGACLLVALVALAGCADAPPGDALDASADHALIRQHMAVTP
jgi:hypothetical protein